LFRCKIAYESSAQDIAVLIAEDLLERVEWPEPTRYPEWPMSLPKHGMSVGYMARLQMSNSASMTYFAQSALSMIVLDEQSQARRFMLGNGIIQSGFSGSAVFSPDGRIHGILVQAYQFPVESGHAHPALHTQPIMACISDVLSDIRGVVQR
jgi:hypothetical protein